MTADASAVPALEQTLRRRLDGEVDFSAAARALYAADASNDRRTPIGIVLPRHLNGILAIDPARKRARVQPGVVLDQFQRGARTTST